MRFGEVAVKLMKPATALTFARFENGALQDARLFGDGYDFQIAVESDYFLAEVKGSEETPEEFDSRTMNSRRLRSFAENFVWRSSAVLRRHLASMWSSTP